VVYFYRPFKVFKNINSKIYKLSGFQPPNGTPANCRLKRHEFCNVQAEKQKTEKTALIQWAF